VAFHHSFSMEDEPVGEQTHLITVSGELDTETHSRLVELMGRLIDDGKRRVVIDLSQATFLDSSALSGLVACSRRLRQQDGMLALVVAGYPRHQPSERLDLTGTREVLNVCESREEALSLVKSAGQTASEEAPPAAEDRTVSLRLYVNGRSPKARQAISALEDLRARLPRGAEVEVIDIAAHPEVAERERLIATPVLVRTAPPPVRRILGDLSDHELVFNALELAPMKGGPR